MRQKIDLTKGNILKDLFIVALPILFISIIQMSYNLTDMFWIASVDQMGLDPDVAVGSIGTAGFYTWLGFGLLMLAKLGTSVKVSQAAGMDDMKLVERIGNNGIILMIFLTIIYTLFGILGAKMFIGWFNTGNGLMDQYSVTYMKIVTSFGLAFYLVNLLNGIYNGLGLAYRTLIITAVGLILNMILDPFFILDTINVFGLFTVPGLALGVKGAALATGIGQSTVFAIYLVIYFSKKYRPFVINLVKEFDWKIIKEITRIGVFVSIQSLLFTFIAMIVAKEIVKHGSTPGEVSRLIGVNRVGSQIESVAWMIASGFQVALASFVGQNFGALKYERIKEGYKRAMQVLIPYGIIVNILLFVFARQLFDIFFDNPLTLDIGQTYLQILSISQLFMIIELASAGVFNGLGKTFYPSVVSVTGNLLRIPAAIILGASIGYAGIWWGVSVSSVLKGTVLVIWLLYFLLRRLGKPGGLVFENKL